MADTVSAAKTLPNRTAVLEGLPEHPAVKAILAWKSEALTDAKFDCGELSLTIARDSIRGVCATLRTAGYNAFQTVTAVDWFPAAPRFQVTYHILSHGYKEILRLCAMVDESDPTIESITTVWAGANYYEREVFDLFGIRFEGHPNLRRILMPDEWVGYPLRKDYPVEGYR
ncbi:MAG TPA: NADH-quinone oxidoreductase subunit C [Terracidiphilus sp.]|nr:NADH-quinone oxidoreductase subunit C [Terracidiphilus sp.]